MDHPAALRPADHAVFRPDKMGKATLYRSDRLLVGLNAFEPGTQYYMELASGKPGDGSLFVSLMAQDTVMNVMGRVG